MKHNEIMSENIELRTLRSSATRDSDIEEYHEIDLDDFAEATTPAHPPKTSTEYDFFSQYDIKTEKKGTAKKKKSRKKEKASNLMDIISSELASVAVPIEENVITRIEHTAEQRSSYLVTTPREQNIFQRRPSYIDSERGRGQEESIANLNPTFPKILENIATEETAIPVHYVKPVRFNEVIANNNSEDQQNTRFLDIELKDIKFKHHHQFSLEKLLCVKLNDLYDEYTNLSSSLKDIERDIKVNRETRDNLKQEFSKISPHKSEDLRFDQTLRKYTGNLLALKEKYVKTLQIEKEMIHKICSLWSDIEMVREKTKHIASSEILTIIKTCVTDEEYDQEWNESFNREFDDMLDKVEYEYVNKYIEYKEVKYTENLDDSAKRRISKPKLHIDEEALKQEVEEIVNNIVTRDKTTIHLKKEPNILSETGKPDKILLRNKYYFEIYVDDVLVCESDHFVSQSDTIPDVEFTEALSVQILPTNSVLSIVLSESKKEVSTLHINLSDIKKIHANSEFFRQMFTYNEFMEPSNKSVGSGHNIKEIASQNKVRLKSSNLFKGNLFTRCEINIKIGWSENLIANNVQAVKSSLEIGRQIERLIHGIDKATTDTLSELIGKIYNKDVSNDEEVLNTLRKLSKLNVKGEDNFPIDENSPEFIRLKLLHLRNNGGMSSIDNKRIPIHASQISTELLNCLQKSKDMDIDVQYFHDRNAEMDPLELQRFIGAKYVQKLNKNLLKNLNEHLLRKTHKDVVRDFKDLSLRSLFTNQSKLSLTTISSSTKQQLMTEAFNREQEIKVTILRAFNLPDRNTLIEESDDDLIAGFKVRPLRPFVRVGYSGVTAQIASSIGCHPSWSQTVHVKAKPAPLSSIHISIFDEYKAQIPDDDDDDESGHTVHYRYSSRWLAGLQVPMHTVLSLGSFRGTFKLTTPPMLFGYENTTAPKESSASLIPAITQLMKKETSFISLHITTSLSHLGGLHGYNQPIPNSGDDYLINHLNCFVTEYINDFPSRNISLTFIDSSGKNKCVTQFLQPIPLPDYEHFPKNPKFRTESALSKSSGLSKSSSSKSSGKRRVETERVLHQSGEERERESLYSSMSWKSGENQLEKVMSACARYVALIPTYDVSESHTVTLLGLELLKVLHGSPLDHTVLLASYFLHLGIRCYIAIGLGLPRGQSSYILTKYNVTSQRPVLMNDQTKSKTFLSRNEGCIWYVHDAVSGERSELRDVGCPLKTVDFVFDIENIWVNVQSSLDCESVSFDLTRSSDWLPVFDKTIYVMKQPVLQDSSLYSAAANVEQLAKTLEAKLKEKVQKWRAHMKTIWNRYCSSLLREMLPHWEYWAFNSTEPKPVPSQRLKQLMVSYKMFGFPLNTPYVNTKSVISTVKSTGVHLSLDPNAEFGLAVEVYAYPNNVLSVWVFLASITRL